MRGGFAHQLEGDLGLDAQSAGVGEEQAHQVRPVGTGEMLAQAHQRSVCQRDFQREAALHRSSMPPGAPEDTVLAHASANRGLETRKRAPHRGAQPERLEGGVKRSPGAAGFYRDGHAVLVDREDPVHSGKIEQHRARHIGRIAAGVAHPPATRDNRMSGAGRSANRGSELMLVARADHGSKRRARCVDVTAVKFETGRIGQDFGAGRCQRLSQRRVRQCCHHAASVVCGSIGGKLSG